MGSRCGAFLCEPSLGAGAVWRGGEGPRRGPEIRSCGKPVRHFCEHPPTLGRGEEGPPADCKRAVTDTLPGMTGSLRTPSLEELVMPRQSGQGGGTVEGCGRSHTGLRFEAVKERRRHESSSLRPGTSSCARAGGRVGRAACPFHSRADWRSSTAIPPRALTMPTAARWGGGPRSPTCARRKALDSWGGDRVARRNASAWPAGVRGESPYSRQLRRRGGGPAGARCMALTEEFYQPGAWRESRLARAPRPT